MSSSRQSLDVQSARVRRGSRPLEATAFALWLACAGCSEPQFDRPDTPDAGASELAGSGKGDAALDADERATSRDASSPEVDAGTRSDPREDAAASAVAEPETGVVREPDRDAGATTQSDAAPAAAEMPSWAEQLVDEFALESITFDASDAVNGVSTSVEYALASIDANYELTTTVCQSGWSNSGASVRLAYPEKLPPRRHRIKFAADSFMTEPIDIAIGYRSDPIPECANKPGELITAPMARSWTSASTCRCPGPLLPPIDDCRVTDPDGDNAPGYTVIGQVVPFAPAEVYGVTESRSTYVNGMPRATGSGFLAQLNVKDSSLQHDCKPRGCADLSGASSSCGPANSRVTFVALSKREVPSGGWNCKAVLARLGELFDSPPAKPSSCK